MEGAHYISGLVEKYTYRAAQYGKGNAGICLGKYRILSAEGARSIFGLAEYTLNVRLSMGKGM